MITIVSGLPRSGTSLMMQMLHAGGMPILCDEDRPADEHNPRGYLEYTKVKSLQNDNSWMVDAEGKVVKIVSLLLYHLPPGHDYRVIFMRRDLDEVLGSQERMLAGLHQPAGPQREQMKEHFMKHLSSLESWIARRDDVKILDCDYAGLVRDPERHTRRVVEFLGLDLPIERMMTAIDPKLYRQRNDPAGN